MENNIPWQRGMIIIGIGFLFCCSLWASAGGAYAHSYPPTKAGLHQLVADDAAMLPAPYAIKLRKKLSDWEHGVGVTCYDFPNKPALCLPEAKDVSADIQAHIFKVDGFVIDSDEWSDRIPAPEVPAPGGGLMQGDRPVALSQVFPKVVSPRSLAATSFNKAAMAFGLAVWADIGGPPRSNPESDNSEDFSIDYAINKVPLSGVISIYYSWGDYTHGAAHGHFAWYGFNWNVAQRRPVEIGDIFNLKTDWKDGLANAIFGSNGIQSDGTQDEVADLAGWIVTNTGLMVDTDRYGDDPPAPLNHSTIFASWSSLKPYLKHGGLAAS